MASVSDRLPDDTVFYSLFPDSTLSSSAAALGDLRPRILDSIASFVSDYIWQHQPFQLSPVGGGGDKLLPPHLHGKTKFGDNLEDEWFVVFLLFHISTAFPSLSVQNADADDQFLLIEAAYSLPHCLNPDTPPTASSSAPTTSTSSPRAASPSTLPSSKPSSPSPAVKPKPICACQNKCKRRFGGGSRSTRSGRCGMCTGRWLGFRRLRHEPCLISAAVEGFYDRDVDAMKFAARMEQFLDKGQSEELVRVTVRILRAMYTQLVQQSFQAPKCYPMPGSGDGGVAEYLEAELGMKIARGFEMMYWMRKRLRSDGRESAWDAFKESFESSGYFRDLLLGSKEYNEYF